VCQEVLEGGLGWEGGCVSGYGSQMGWLRGSARRGNRHGGGTGEAYYPGPGLAILAGELLELCETDVLKGGHQNRRV
jgi:hypothetical protein